MKTTILSEAIDLTEAQLDVENRVIRGVVLIRSGMSKNRRFYGDTVLQTAAPVFEGSRAYANHPSKSESKDRPERSIRDLTGFYKNVTYENGILKADRHFLRTSAGNDAWEIAQAVATGNAPPSLAGLSINAIGTGKVEPFEDGEALRVESITSAISVDDVSQAAAGGSYALTASAGDELVTGLLEALSFEEWQTARPDLIERLKREWKTVRLDEETKRVLAESENKIKTADTKAAESAQALSEAQAQHQALIEANTNLQSELRIARRELALEKALVKVKLPDLYLEDLRKRLPQSPVGEWAALIEIEIAKARKTNPPRVPVTGASAQENNPLPTVPIPDTQANLIPLDGEDAEAWARRVGLRKP